MHRITIVISMALALAGGSVNAVAQVEPASIRKHSIAWERTPATGGKATSALNVLQKRAYLEVELVLLREALAELSARADVSLVYSPSLLPEAAVSCNCRRVTVGDALQRLLSHTGFEFMEDQNQILIEPGSSEPTESSQLSPVASSRISPSLAARPFTQESSQMNRKVMSYGRGIVVAGAIAAGAPGGLSAQEHEVTGRVVSSELAPLAGVSVVVQGTTIGTLTNSSGNYTISAPSGTESLVFSMLGTRTQVEPIDGRSIINVTLETEALALDEIVVVGYGEQTRATVSGAVSSVSNEDIERSSANTVSEMLVGKVAGINTRMTTATGTSQFRGRVPEDGRPGSGAALQIRNLGDPLFVIDGVPATSLEFNQINAADIDNISILKDASASVYGFRAANGVVLVTTKRGTGLRTPQLNITADYGVGNLQRNRAKTGWGDTAYQFLYSNVEWQQNTGRPREMTAEELELWRLGGPGYESHPSWPEFIRSDAPMANINANVSGGGNNNASYYVGLGYTTQDYAQLDNNFSRANVQANVSTDVFTGFSVGTEIRGRREDHTNVANTNSSSVNNIGDPQLVYWQAHDSQWPHQDPWANGNREFINGDVRYFVRTPGSFRRAVGGTQDQIRTNITGNFWAAYELPFGPVIRATYSQTKDLEEFDVHRYSFNGYCYDEATDTYNVCDTYSGQSRRSIRAVGDRDYMELRLSHSLNFGSHTLSFVTGAERSGGDMTTHHMYSLPSSNFNSLIDFAEVLDARNEWETQRRASYIGRLNYDYQQKYLAEVVGRYDGSYLYAPGKRWGLFPGVSLGWRITEEPFFANAVPFLDELKLRASWGQAGREQGISDWGFLGGATLGQGLPAVLSGTVVPAIEPRGLPVTNLSWVTSTTRNLGVDFALLNGKLAGELDLFERKLSGLPASRYDVALPSELGYSLPNENLESETNIGFDGIIRYSDMFGDVSFSFAPNFTLARRKILDRYKPRYGNSWLEYRQGEENRWAGTNFTVRWTGEVFQSMEEIARHPVDIDGQGNRTLLPGDMIFEDTNGDGQINALDQRVRVFPAGETPILNFGLNGSVGYAGVTLSYDFGGGALYGFNAVMNPYGTHHNGGTYTSSRWRRADLFDDNSEWIPGKFPPLRKESHSSYRTSTRDYVNARYFRLRHVELGYEVPASLANRVGLARLRVFGNGGNAFLLDNIQEWAVDPEIAYTNALNYPYPVTWTAGLTASVGGSPTQQAPVPIAP